MDTLRTLPGDDVRQIMWRYADRYDLQMVVQSARSLARSLVARLVAEGARHTHEWTDHKAQLLDAFDSSGLTALFMDPHQGGFIEGPKNLALALVAFELAWVDAGAATCSLGHQPGPGPHPREAAPPSSATTTWACACRPSPARTAPIFRGAFALTEPLPYVGVETNTLVGKLRVAKWEEGPGAHPPGGQARPLHHRHGLRQFRHLPPWTPTTPRIKSSCIDHRGRHRPRPVRPWRAHPEDGAPALLHARPGVQRDRCPPSRIVGGYTVKDGVIVPNFTHSEIIGAVFHRTRVPVALMSTAKLLSAIEPVIRYQRQRFRGGDASEPGTPKYRAGSAAEAGLRTAPGGRCGPWARPGASLGFATCPPLRPAGPHREGQGQGRVRREGRHGASSPS